MALPTTAVFCMLFSEKLGLMRNADEYVESLGQGIAEVEGILRRGEYFGEFQHKQFNSLPMIPPV
jgi:hypothetical protein